MSAEQNLFTRFRARYIIVDYFLIAILLGIVVGFIQAIFGIKINFNSKEPVFLASLYAFIMISICFTSWWRLKKLQIEPLQLIGKRSLKNVSWLYLLIVFYADRNLATGINRLAMFFIHLISPDLVEIQIDKMSLGLDPNSSNFPSIALILFVVIIVAPITEEFLFRGILLHRWSAKWGKTPAILISSILFGLAHMDMFFLSRIFSGTILSLLYLETKTLLVPIALHSANNLIFCISKLVEAFSSTNKNLEINYSTLWYGLLNIALVLPVLVYFIKWSKNSEPLPYNANQKS
ncbi:MAG: lysostaphin resistance A-like protein [Xenococcaceae cyanobacterium]